MQIWNELTELWRDQNAARGYREVRTPILYDVELWKQSGHWDVYRDHMYFTDVEERAMGMKPMNCPAHIQIYARAALLPRPADPLLRAGPGAPARAQRHAPRAAAGAHITQDDAHIFCTEEQIQEEVHRCLDFGFAIYDVFGFVPRLELSTRPDKRVGSDEMWDKAEAALERALVTRGSSSSSTRATARSTARRSTCT